MGVKNLYKLISEYAPNSITKKNIKEYNDKYVVLDASMIIYQYVIAIRGSGSDLQNTEGKLTSHILGVLSKTFLLLGNDIIPIFVFDGTPPELKKETLKSRKEIKKKNLEKLEATDDKEDQIKYFKRSFSITQAQIQEVKDILTLFGIPVIESATEADPLCANIVSKGLAYGVSSEDMDLLAFGCSKLIRSLSSKKKAIEIDLKEVLNSMELTQDQFVDLCILLGCDYCDTIPKIGPKRAYEKIKEHGSIKNFLENDEKVKSGYYKIPENYQENYTNAAEFFKSPPIVTNVTKAQLKMRKPKYNQIKEIMIDIYDFKLNKVNQYLNKIKAFYNKSTNKPNKQIKKYIVSEVI